MAMTLRADKGAILSWNEMDANFSACMGAHNFLHVQDQKSSGTHPGEFTAGAWRTRTLNTVLVNGIAGATLVANVISLPAGSYISDAICTYYNGGSPAPGSVQARLFNVSASTELVLSLSGYEASSTGNYSSGFSILRGTFTLSSTTSVEFQHRCATTRATNGLGYPSGFSTEIFADVRIWKVS